MIRGARCALNRSVIEGYPIGWFVSISRILLFDSHLHCFLLLLLLLALRSSKDKSTEGHTQAVQKIVPKPA